MDKPNPFVKGYRYEEFLYLSTNEIQSGEIDFWE